MNKQQAIEVLRKVESHLLGGETDLKMAADLIRYATDTLDDAYKGFSNYETFATVKYIRMCWDKEDYRRLDRQQLASKVAKEDPEYTEIGSLWRVNWTEVATALRGEGER